MTGGGRQWHEPLPASLRTVVVDLTPVLPGGENGGAKVFALELVRRLAARSPDTRFILLTQHAAHDELAAMDAANVARVMAVGPRAAAARRPMIDAARRAAAWLPAPVHRHAAAAGYRVHSLLKRRGRGLARTLGADLLFCPFTAPTYREPGLPTICTLYDLQYRAHPGFFAVEDAVARDRAFREMAVHADRIAAISDFSRREAQAAAAIPDERIRTVHLRLGASRVVPRAGELQRSLQGAPYLLYPANFWKHKNHELLLTAYALARSQGLAARLVCTGAPGERAEHVQAAAHRMGLGDAVSFPGFVPAEESAALLAGARALVFPSLHEGFGLPVVEAMAAGIPVACSNLTALPEVAGDAARLFDPRVPTDIAQAIREVCEDEATRARLIAAGRARAPQFADADRMAAEYAALFVEAIGDVPLSRRAQ